MCANVEIVNRHSGRIEQHRLNIICEEKRHSTHLSQLQQPTDDHFFQNQLTATLITL